MHIDSVYLDVAERNVEKAIEERGTFKIATASDDILDKISEKFTAAVQTLYCDVEPELHGHLSGLQPILEKSIALAQQNQKLTEENLKTLKETSENLKKNKPWIMAYKSMQIIGQVAIVALEIMGQDAWANAGKLALSAVDFGVNAFAGDALNPMEPALKQAGGGQGWLDLTEEEKKAVDERKRVAKEIHGVICPDPQANQSGVQGYGEAGSQFPALNLADNGIDIRFVHKRLNQSNLRGWASWKNAKNVAEKAQSWDQSNVNFFSLKGPPS